MRRHTAPAGTTAQVRAAAEDWNPPANLVQPLNEVWNHVSSTCPDLYGHQDGNYSRCPGGAAQITEVDKWMFRDFWRRLKSRYGL